MLTIQGASSGEWPPAAGPAAHSWPPHGRASPTPPAASLCPRPAGVGDYVRFSEVAFFHKASRSLLVTDAVVYVPDEAPEVISTKVCGGA